MSNQPPAFKAQSAKASARWRKTPPALYPPVLGLFGLAAGWSRTPDAFGASPAIGQFLMGAMVLLYMFVAGYYLAKAVARPGVVVEDLTRLPGRAGLAALTMAGMLFSAALIPYSVALAKAVLVLAVGGHLAILGLIIRALLTGPAESRRVTPVYHLTFVGLIVSPIPALQFGWVGYATLVFWVTLAAAVVIWGLSARQFARETVPAPLRPLLAIHLAPAALLGTVAMMLQMPALGLAFGLIAIAILAVLLLGARWITAAGFSPFWGAFTFPLAAFSSLMLILAGYGFGNVYRVLGGLVLVAATFLIPWIAMKVFQMWLKGQLAAKTNSAVA